MRIASVIAWRDLQSLFLSLKAYVVITLQMLLFGLFFYLNMAEAKEASMRQMFQVMNFFFLFIVPVITMSSLADERRHGTMELLMTVPIRRWEIVAGKFLASLAFYGAVVALTGQFYVLMSMAGRPDPGPVLTGYLGLMLSGGLFIAIGLYSSSLTESPLVAALLSYAVLLAGFLITTLPSYLPQGLAAFVTQLGFPEHLAAFERGLVRSQDLAYFLTGTGLFLAATTVGLAPEAEASLV